MIFSPKLPIHLNPLQPRGRRRRHLAAPNHARTPTHHLRQCRRITTTRLPQAYQSSFIRSTSKFCRRILAHTRPSQTASSCASKLSEGSVDADLRRRCKCLLYIPEGTIKAQYARRRGKDRRDKKARARAEERERSGRGRTIQNNYGRRQPCMGYVRARTGIRSGHFSPHISLPHPIPNSTLSAAQAAASATAERRMGCTQLCCLYPLSYPLVTLLSPYIASIVPLSALV